MDGTLLNSKGEIPCENSRAVRYFMENGGMFAVATGRAKKSVERFLPGLETNVPSIVHNGSLISDLSTGRIVRQMSSMSQGIMTIPKGTTGMWAWSLLKGITGM